MAYLLLNGVCLFVNLNLYVIKEWQRKRLYSVVFRLAAANFLITSFCFFNAYPNLFIYFVVVVVLREFN